VSRALCVHSASVAQTIALGRAIGEAAQARDVIALHGELGSGKTQLVRGLAQGLGLDPRQVSSPTFVISHEYLPPPPPPPEVSPQDVSPPPPEVAPPEVSSPEVSSPEVSSRRAAQAPRALCLVHVDAYRLTGPDELRTIGLGDADDEVLDDAVLVIEWADRVAEALGGEALHVRLEHAEGGRRITLEPRGTWASRLEKLNLTELMADD